LFVFSSGKQFGLYTNLDKNSHNDLVINMDTMSNGQTIKLNHENEPNTLLNFFSNLTSSIRLPTSLKSSYGKQSRQFNSKYYKKQENGIIKHEKNDSIYHQLNIHTINDENNNNNPIQNELNQNSIVINLLSSQSDEYLNNDINEKYFFTIEHFLWIFILTIFYFTWFIFIAGITIIHLIVYLFIISLYLLSDRTRRFALAILIYLTYLFLYDSLHVIPNYTISNVHIEDIYYVEKKFFGIFKNGQLMTLNEYFKLNHIPFLDVFTGLCYLNWIPIPLVYSFYLYRYKNKRDYMDFAFTFLLTNLLGFIIYYIVPAA